MKDECEWCRTA